MRRIILGLLVMMISIAAIAQNTVTDIKTEEGFMRSEGKIYVVMTIVVTILAGLIIYLVRLDRKISKLERGDNS